MVKKDSMKTQVTSKTGRLTARHQHAFNAIISGNGKSYPRSWVRNGCKVSLRSIEHNVMDLAKVNGLKVKTGNDAARGGQEGYFIQFSSRGLEKLKALYGSDPRTVCK